MIECSVFIMNKNDVEGARNIIPRIPKGLFKAIKVIDGNSTDGSIEYFKSQGLEPDVLKEGGRGGAFRHALTVCQTPYLVFLSSDGEEAPEDLPKFLEQFEKGADMVIASRLAPGGYHKAQANIKWLHRMLYLRLYTFFLNLSFGTKLTDCWNGYRGFRLAALKSVKTDALGYLIEAQQTIRFKKAGYKICEFPTKEGERIGGASGNPIFQSGYQHITMLFRELFN
jgi:glycosyltransferase involved in cell wall biosynthesis